MLDKIYTKLEDIYMKKPSRWAAFMIAYFVLGIVLGIALGH